VGGPDGPARAAGGRIFTVVYSRTLRPSCIRPRLRHVLFLYPRSTKRPHSCYDFMASDAQSGYLQISGPFIPAQPLDSH